MNLGELVPYVLAVSILLQLGAAFVALALIRQTGVFVPWVLVSSAITLMGVRRITSFVGMLQRQSFPTTALGPELIALLISTLMLTGLFLLKPAFRLVARAKEQELSAKDVLIRESHHHVKNDLQMLQSLIRLQSGASSSQRERDMLDELALRVRAFSVLHEYIYRGTQGRVSFRDYIGNLAQAVAEAHPQLPVRLEMDLGDVPVDRRSLLYCGLIVNEALTNAYKYAFDESVKRPAISLSTRLREGQVVLEIADNGVGLSEEGSEAWKESYGMKLMHAIGAYPGWSLEIDSQGSEGTRIVCMFPTAEEARAS